MTIDPTLPRIVALCSLAVGYCALALALLWFVRALAAFIDAVRRLL